MVNKALVLANHRGVMECKRKLVCQHQSGRSSRPCVATSSVGPVFHPAQPQFQLRLPAAGQGFSSPQRQVIQSVQRTQADHRCYNCGDKGHHVNRCPNPHTRANQTATTTPAPMCRANSIPVATKQNYARGKVNHVAMEEAQEAPDMVIGMFFVNNTSAVVLFDSRASHSFISAAYVEQHNLPVALLRCQMIVSSLGGDMPEGES
jgi:hypothetical protein